ncbi:conserved hypothetical protein [Anaeromyxobacter dehalogenans 2CP-1]|uniref:Lipoprotein n=1 Tax=Anaeromyxobacter dehalogenans (strain ATCC BAA-258 / DSM 21875 / 2CP-1) TaxID=455488 RepID=B8JFD8_ANAD2|nr:hypothetical protein [Anaeromyxobacter dehalogenans]ACL66315.1 conserved hypothetical protein [Anaeromyxobacter dehalogenans 2CP-1]
MNVLRIAAAAALAAALPAPSAHAADRIPVYPGARLLAVPLEPGESPECCTFVTADPAAKVTAWYATALSLPALDRAAFERRYPELREAMALLAAAAEHRAPRDLRLFVLREEPVGGKRMPTLTLAILSTTEGTVFEIGEEELGSEGPRWAETMRRAHRARR